jgi:hypothetical protein
MGTKWILGEDGMVHEVADGDRLEMLRKTFGDGDFDGIATPKDQPNETILEEAIRITGGDRNTDYGSAVDDFARIAGMWNILFGGKGNGQPFKPADVALAMCCVKLSRQSHRPKRDSWVDLAGYAHCGAQCDEAEGQ